MTYTLLTLNLLAFLAVAFKAGNILHFPGMALIDAGSTSARIQRTAREWRRRTRRLQQRARSGT